MTEPVEDILINSYFKRGYFDKKEGTTKYPKEYEDWKEEFQKLYEIGRLIFIENPHIDFENMTLHETLNLKHKIVVFHI
jgi:hypothetical protein